ncbi:MAG: hypothetical protein QOG31_722 [Thermoplasmata archaeon]|nr:hypothetical protein [Thermoplasmata archaeon]
MNPAPPATAVRSAALLALTALLLAPLAQAHNPSEASELETLLIEDEGTDLIEPYGGYDINAVYLGMAHDPAVGAGALGDGLYFRAELYGDRANQNVPSPPGSEEWRVSFAFQTAKGAESRFVATKDGKTFTTNFDALLLQTESAKRELHVQRAFVSFATLGVEPGTTLKGLTVTSSVGGDPRDVAPGGIPVPYTGGAQTYPDPTAIAGRGAVVEEATLGPPTGYLRFTGAAASGGGNYTVRVQSALAKTGQHVHLQPRNQAGWGLAFTSPDVVPTGPAGNVTFSFHAVPAADAGDLALDLVTDVGGRLPVILHSDGTLEAMGHSFTPPPPAKASPGASLLALVALLGLASAFRARRA